METCKDCGWSMKFVIDQIAEKDVSKNTIGAPRKVMRSVEKIDLGLFCRKGQFNPHTGQGQVFENTPKCPEFIYSLKSSPKNSQTDSNDV